jgi:signal peptidase I
LRKTTLVRTLLGSVLLCALLFGVLGVRPLVVLGSSMKPTLEPGQLAWLDREYYRGRSIKRGDVVVFRWQGQSYVKRVHALPGERVTLMCADDTSWPISAACAARVHRLADRFHYLSVRTVVVPLGTIFCMGDNVNASVDSRQLGPIPISAILGHVSALTGATLPPSHETL